MVRKLERYTRAADAGDNETLNFVNYGVKKKVEGKYKRNRILMICGYVIFSLIYVLIFLVPVKMPTLIAVLPVLLRILFLATWYKVSIEYEYTIAAGVIKLLEVFGSRYYRTIAEVRVSAMSVIAPYNREYKPQADSDAVKNRYYCVSCMETPDLYFGRYKNEQGEECVVFFEATEKTLKVMKYYNENVVIAKTTH